MKPSGVASAVDDAARPAGRTKAMVATAATLITWALVALLASRPESPLTPPLPPGAEAPSFLAAPARILGLDRLSQDAAGSLSAVLLLGAGIAFLYSAREAWRGTLSVGRIVAVGVMLHALAVAIPLFLSRDVYSYSIYGRMVSVLGANPFVSTPADFAGDPMFPFVSEDWNEMPSVYGPGFLTIAAAVTALVGSPAGLIVAFKTVAASASVATMLLVVVAARRVRPERAAFGAILIGWNPVVVLHGTAGGHSDALVGLAVAAGALLLLARRELVATAALALGALVKVVGGVPLLMAMVGTSLRRARGERTRAFAARAGIAAAVALPFVVPFLQTRDPTLGLSNLVPVQGWLAPSRLLAVTIGSVGRALGSPVAGEVLGIVVRLVFPAVFFVALAGVIRHLARAPGRIGPEVVVAGMAWISLIGLMTSPLLLPWYVVWLLPLAWVLPRSARTAAVAMAALGVTQSVAEPSRAPGAWEVMVLGIHYVAGPVILALLVWVLRDLRKRLALAPGAGLAHPLLVEEPGRQEEKRPVPRSSGGRDSATRAPAGVGDPQGGQVADRAE